MIPRKTDVHAWSGLDGLRPRVLAAHGRSIQQTRIYGWGGCSVLFEDPDKFAKLEQLEGIARHGLPPRPRER